MADIEQETWKNATKGIVGILRLDVRGMEYGQVVDPGRKFSLSPVERQMNQDRAASTEQDLFSNGTLEPAGSFAAKLLDDDAPEEYKEIASNPNFISEDEINGLFKLRIDAFRRRLADIQNPNVVQRVLEIANEVDAKSSQINAIQKRLDEFKPELLIEVESAGDLGPMAGPATPA